MADLYNRGYDLQVIVRFGYSGRRRGNGDEASPRLSSWLPYDNTIAAQANLHLANRRRRRAGGNSVEGVCLPNDQIADPICSHRKGT